MFPNKSAVHHFEFSCRIYSGRQVYTLWYVFNATAGLTKDQLSTFPRALLYLIF